MRCGVQEKENVNQTDMVIGNLGHEIGTGISGGGTVEHGGCCLRKMGVLVRDEARRESRQTQDGRTVATRVRYREETWRTGDGRKEKVGTGGSDTKGEKEGGRSHDRPRKSSEGQ